jgi:hypothetical protein
MRADPAPAAKASRFSLPAIIHNFFVACCLGPFASEPAYRCVPEILKELEAESLLYWKQNPCYNQRGMCG